MARLLALLALVGLAHGQYDYGEALGKSILFYEAQRTGPLPSDNRVDWRGDAATGDDILGGYFDAGDHVKFGFPAAFSQTMLAWGALNYFNGFEQAGEADNMRKNLKWGADYFMAAHKSKFELVGQIGDGDADHAYWGRPEDMDMARPAFSITEGCPGSDLAAETAAALAATSMVFEQHYGDSGYANQALDHARDLFEFADTKRGEYTDCIPAGNFYGTFSGFGDELAWAAAWMHKATGEQSYLDKAEQFFDEFSLDYEMTSGHAWENKVMGAQALLFSITGNDRYRNLMQAEANFYIYEAQRTPKGLIWLSQWGSIRNILNTVLPLLEVADAGLMANEIRDMAKEQVDYALGSSGRSFVVGFGNNPPQSPHHRGASCQDMPAPCDWNDFNSPNPNPQILTGALVGGPDAQDNYNDSRDDYVQNEVAIDYNSGFTGVLAAVIQLGL